MMEYKDIPEKIRQEMFWDGFFFGNSFCLKHKDGSYERINPTKVILHPQTKKWVIIK